MSDATTPTATSAVAIDSTPATPAPPPVVTRSEPSPEAYLAKIQEASNKYLAGETSSVPAPSEPGASSTEPVGAEPSPESAAAEATAYKPEEGQKAEPEKAAETTTPEATETPEAQADKPVEAKDGESIRQIIKRSNLPTDLKETITNLAFKADAFDKIGFTVEQARQLKDLGITPEIIAERIGIHQSVEDERRDAELAISMRQLGTDLTQDPAAFVDGILATAPEVAQNLIAAAYERAAYVMPERIVDEKVNGVWEALNGAYSDMANSDDEALLEALRTVASAFFPDGAPVVDDQPGYVAEDGLANSADPIHREYAKLKADQERFAAEQRQSFAGAMFNHGRQAVWEATKAAWEEVKPQSMPKEVSDVVAKQIFDQVGAALLSNEGIKRDMEGFLSGNLDQAQFNRAVSWLLERAKPTILINRKPALDYWSKVFAGSAPAPQQAPAQKPAIKGSAPLTKPDIGRASSAPAPTNVVDVKAQVFKEAKANHWDNLRIIQEVQARTKALSR